MGDTMNKDEYQKMVKELTPKENKVKKSLIAFFVGGSLGFISEVIVMILINCFGVIETDAYSYLCIGLIFIASLLTSLGFFDNLVSKSGAGLFLPTTGFAHSITSSALDYKKDGLITGLGSSFFKLAGSVLLYGILSGFFFSILGVIIYG